jgi:hypothetical protein
VSGEIFIPGADCESEDMPQYATLSFRQEIECDDGSNIELIEIKSLNIANCSDFIQESLPVINLDAPCGDYQLVVYSYQRQTEQEAPLIITSGIDNDLGTISLLTITP